MLGVEDDWSPFVSQVTLCSTSYSTHPPQPVIAHVYICVCSDYTCCALIGFISNVIIISENKQSFLDKVFLIAFCTKQNVIKKNVFTKQWTHLMWLKWHCLVLRFYLYFGCLKLLWKPLHRTITLVRPGDCPFLCEGAVFHGDNHIASWRQNATLNEAILVAMAIFSMSSPIPLCTVTGRSNGGSP